MLAEIAASTSRPECSTWSAGTASPGPPSSPTRPRRWCRSPVRWPRDGRWPPVPAATSSAPTSNSAAGAGDRLRRRRHRRGGRGHCNRGLLQRAGRDCTAAARVLAHGESPRSSPGPGRAGKGRHHDLRSPAEDEEGWIPPVNNPSQLERVLGFLLEIPKHAVLAAGGNRLVTRASTSNRRSSAICARGPASRKRSSGR